MQQIGYVKEVLDDKAKVEVARNSMCDGCSKKECDGECTVSDMFNSSKKMTVLANNEPLAKVGDKVLLETESSTILKYALIVFILPIVLFVGAYLIAHQLLGSETYALIISIAAFVLCFLFIGIYEKIVSKRKINVNIVKILE